MNLSLKKIIGIHQPNFFPWIGYFFKIDQSDIFVFYDSCRGDSKLNYEKRIKILDLIANKNKIIGLPTHKLHKMSDNNYPRLNQIEIFEPAKSKKRLLAQIFNNYKKEKHFEANYEWIEKLVNFESNLLIEYNINAIKKIAEKLKIDSIFVKSENLGINTFGNQANLDIVIKLNGEIYLSGHGSDSYQDTTLFKEKNVEINFTKNLSKQFFEKKPYIKNSIIDLLMYDGLEFTSNLIKDVKNNKIK
ncbi:WbqC family protein [Prochlorococcus marinus XMU1419]|uniref:WbqC family protein n=1 Tax=Prochlorococcus marinus TaxID=1219 RepID=UPI001AD95E3D|nr:WbqC family protein [Prochlorococcus marinus]MBO8234250.1 WbqC family protein [Prochlorococcus marinus XMU1419]MBW3075940.1 hypothetical protein [Prochlorococcus marinus str. XMU1419]